ncbi:MAG: tRNA epoxyqueuosine(34) reductase QueG [Phycisphaerales bacterium]
MRSTPLETARALLDLARGLGFACAGVCGVEPSRWRDELRTWLDAGKHGEMGYLAQNSELRENPSRLLEGARSILVVADRYAPRGDADQPSAAAARGRIARYARGNDYHKVIKRRLHELCDRAREWRPDAEFRAFVDTAPVLERELAARAGIGWVAKHTLVINPALGSYLLLGGVATTLELEAPPEQPVVTDHCGTCTRCIEACPTNAITPYSVDATRCVSYLTIERRPRIAPEFFEGVRDWIFGCDICQEVCPHNSERRTDVAPPIPDEYTPRRDSFDLLEVLAWTEEHRREAFKSSSMKRATLAMMRRNALIAAGNAIRERGDAGLKRRIEEIASATNEDEMVRQTAIDVLAGL